MIVILRARLLGVSGRKIPVLRGRVLTTVMEPGGHRSAGALGSHTNRAGLHRCGGTRVCRGVLCILTDLGRAASTEREHAERRVVDAST